jgi:hypothetical protein
MHLGRSTAASGSDVLGSAGSPDVGTAFRHAGAVTTWQRGRAPIALVGLLLLLVSASVDRASAVPLPPGSSPRAAAPGQRLSGDCAVAQAQVGTLQATATHLATKLKKARKELRKARAAGSRSRVGTVRKKVRKLKAKVASNRAAFGVAQQALATACAPPLPGPHQGTVELTIAAPPGIAGSVRLTPTTGAGVVRGKSPDATSDVSSHVVDPGIWQVDPQPFVQAGKLYLAEPATAQVAAGAVVPVRVEFRAAPVASDLEVTALAPHQVSLEWTSPSGIGPDDVVVRYAEGSEAPRSVTEGMAATVTGETAVIAGLAATTEHAFAVFTRVGGRWLGPISLTATTLPTAEPTGPTATWATAPGVALLPDDASVTRTDTGALARRTGWVPVVGQAVVLRPSAQLPAGLVGEVSDLASDGTALVVPTSLDAAFDLLDYDVPDLAAEPPAQGARTSRASAASGTGFECEAGIDASFSTVSLALGGHLQGSVLTSTIAGVAVPVGASYDAELTLTLKVAAQIESQAAAGCSVSLAKVKRTFWVGVPVAVEFEPRAQLEVTTSISVSGLGFEATGGFWAKGSVKADGTGTNDNGTIRDAKLLEPQGEVSADVHLKLGGTLFAGPGATSDWAGATAGIQGELNPLDLGVAVKSIDPGCIQFSAGLSGSVDLLAKAWVGALKLEAKRPVFTGAVAYGDPWFVPSGCEANLPDPTDFCAGQTSVPKTECLVLMAIKTANPQAVSLGGWGTGDPCEWNEITCRWDGTTRVVDTLSLFHDDVTDVPSSIRDLAHLRGLRLAGNPLAGLPAGLWDLSSLENLDLSGTGLSSLPADVGDLSHLTELLLADNALTDLPDEVGSVDELAWLLLDHNQLTSVPAVVWQLAGLEHLWLTSNQLTTLSSAVGNLSGLVELLLFDNQLADLPDELWTLSNLERLDLGANQLTQVPAAIGDLTNLTSLDLQVNQLTSLPPEIGQLTRLTSLGLAINRLSTLPASIGELRHLEDLGLHQNYYLAGDISAWASGLHQAATLTRLTLWGTGCLDVGTDVALALWLDGLDPQWRGGCSG